MKKTYREVKLFSLFIRQLIIRIQVLIIQIVFMLKVVKMKNKIIKKMKMLIIETNLNL